MIQKAYHFLKKMKDLIAKLKFYCIFVALIK